MPLHPFPPLQPADAVFKDRSTRGGMAYKAAAAAAREGSVHGGNGSVHGGEGSTRGRGIGFRGAASAALAAVRLERSVRGGDRSVRGGDRSVRGGDRSVRGGDRSVRGGAVLEASVRGGTAGMYLPVATPYSHRLAQLFDRLRIQPGGRIVCECLCPGVWDRGGNRVGGTPVNSGVPVEGCIPAAAAGKRLHVAATTARRRLGQLPRLLASAPHVASHTSPGHGTHCGSAWQARRSIGGSCRQR